ncbi:hypothetical protein HK405_000763, partial [Cladochytrium tenue]
TLLSASTKGELLKAVMRGYLRCDTYNGSPIQYFQTYICLTNIYHFSSGCNADLASSSSGLAVCSSTCSAFGEAVGNLLHEKRRCVDLWSKGFGHFGPSKRKVASRRLKLWKGSKVCATISKKLTGDGAECHYGLGPDETSCGMLT